MIYPLNDTVKWIKRQKGNIYNFCLINDIYQYIQSIKHYEKINNIKDSNCEYSISDSVNPSNKFPFINI